MKSHTQIQYLNNFITYKLYILHIIAQQSSKGGGHSGTAPIIKRSALNAFKSSSLHRNDETEHLGVGNVWWSLETSSAIGDSDLAKGTSTWLDWKSADVEFVVTGKKVDVLLELE